MFNTDVYQVAMYKLQSRLVRLGTAGAKPKGNMPKMRLLERLSGLAYFRIDKGQRYHEARGRVHLPKVWG